MRVHAGEIFTERLRVRARETSFLSKLRHVLNLVGKEKPEPHYFINLCFRYEERRITRCVS